MTPPSSFEGLGSRLQSTQTSHHSTANLTDLAPLQTAGTTENLTPLQTSLQTSHHYRPIATAARTPG